MRCAYPLCYHLALWLPVIELPTLRTVGNSRAMVETSQPTTLLCREVCGVHRATYNLAEWVPAADWAYLQEVAHANGYHIPEITIVTVQFKPLGWHPRNTFELER